MKRLSRVLQYLLFVLLCLLLQSSAVTHVSVWGIRPDLVTLLLTYIAMWEGQVWGVLVGFSAGLAQDVYAPEHLGLNALSKSVTGFLVGYSRGGIATENAIVRTCLVLSSVLVHDLLYYSAHSFLSPDVSGPASVIPSIVSPFVRFSLGGAVYTALLSATVTWVFSRALRQGEQQA